MQRLRDKMAIGRADEEWRAAKHREAVERGTRSRRVGSGSSQSAASVATIRRAVDYGGVVRCQHCDTEQVAP
jgi:hypothetical protein